MTDAIKALMEASWNAAVNEAANVQEKGFTYQPMTFEQFWKEKKDWIVEYFIKPEDR